jgi:hypothetical protein
MKKKNPFTSYAEQYGSSKQSGDISFATLDALRDGGVGKMEHPCPLCGPEREPPMSERLVLATWEETPGIITYGMCTVRRQRLCAYR